MYLLVVFLRLFLLSNHILPVGLAFSLVKRAIRVCESARVRNECELNERMCVLIRLCQLPTSQFELSGFACLLDWRLVPFWKWQKVSMLPLRVFPRDGRLIGKETPINFLFRLAESYCCWVSSWRRARWAGDNGWAGVGNRIIGHSGSGNSELII
jgi:hypothetical protein